MVGKEVWYIDLDGLCPSLHLKKARITERYLVEILSAGSSVLTEDFTLRFTGNHPKGLDDIELRMLDDRHIIPGDMSERARDLVAANRMGRQK